MAPLVRSGLFPKRSTSAYPEPSSNPSTDGDCLGYQQYGDSRVIGLKMSEWVVERDFDALRELDDCFIEQLENLKLN